MQINVTNAKIYRAKHFSTGEFFLPVTGAGISGSGAADTVSFNNCFIFPGFADVHVHLRTPGFSYKETMETGTRAAARGGYTDVCAMPNLKPVPDSIENLKIENDIIKKEAVIRVHPYAAITKQELGTELSDLEGMAPSCIAFSDDGRGVQSQSMMRDAMVLAKKLGKIIAAHCEDNTLLKGGYIHDGEYARLHGHRGICSESEWGPIKRDVLLAKETGCAYHVCHVSTKESVEIIRQAKKEGVNVTCETGPHYLILNDMDLQEDGRFKMNPPLRSKADQDALIEGILDGTIDMIATDHAPHSAEEKSRGLEKSLMGVVGIETAFPLLYTYLVKKNIISLEQLLMLMIDNPRERFNLPVHEGDCCIFDPEREETIDPEDFLSMGRATPFAGWKVNGVNLATVKEGELVWLKK